MKLKRFLLFILFVLSAIKIMFFQRLSSIGYVFYLSIILLVALLLILLVVSLPNIKKMPLFLFSNNKKISSVTDLRNNIYAVFSLLELVLFFPGYALVMYKAKKSGYEITSMTGTMQLLETKTNNLVRISLIQLAIIAGAICIYQFEQDKSSYIIYMFSVFVACNLLKYLGLLIAPVSVPKLIRETGLKAFYYFILLLVVDVVITFLLFLSINFINQPTFFSISHIHFVYEKVNLFNRDSLVHFFSHSTSMLEKVEYFSGFLFYTAVIKYAWKYKEFQRNDDDYLKIVLYKCLVRQYDDAEMILKKVKNSSVESLRLWVIINVAKGNYEDAYKSCSRFLSLKGEKHRKLSVFTECLSLATIHKVPVERVIDEYKICIEKGIDDITLASITNVYLIQELSSAQLISDTFFDMIDLSVLATRYQLTIYSFYKFNSKVTGENAFSFLYEYSSAKTGAELLLTNIVLLSELLSDPKLVGPISFNKQDYKKFIIQRIEETEKELLQLNDFNKLAFYGRLKFLEAYYKDDFSSRLAQFNRMLLKSISPRFETELVKLDKWRQEKMNTI